MILSPLPANEAERLAELYKYDILDTPYEEEYDDIVKLASQICNAPISTITLLDSSRQWFKAKVGVEPREGDRETSFCGHVIVSDTELMEVEDATQDDRFFDNPLVIDEPRIRFYAGVPLTCSNGCKLGTLCVIDNKPKNLTLQQSFALKVLGKQVMQNIELRIRNKQLDQLYKKLDQQNYTQNKIISIIAHDVRTPIASLKNIVELTHSNILNAQEAAELTQMTEKQLDNTLILLSDLVEWGKLQMASDNLEKDEIDIHELIEEKVKVFEVSASLKGIKIKNLTTKGTKVISDKNALRFILRNLISNAIKFTASGEVSVASIETPDATTIVIKDSGIGISPKAMEKLYSPDGRYTTIGTNNEKGNGLGLMLTFDFMELLGGNMQIESEQGKGTTIYLHFERKG